MPLFPRAQPQPIGGAGEPKRSRNLIGRPRTPRSRRRFHRRLSVGVDKYLQKFIDDCCEPAVQQNVKKQLLALDASARAPMEIHLRVHPSQRQPPAEKAGLASRTRGFLRLMKTNHPGFNTSQKVMEDYYHYKVAPVILWLRKCKSVKLSG